MLLNRKAVPVFKIALLIIISAVAGYGQQPQPRPIGPRSFPNSVILNGGSYAANMQRLRVSRKYALSDLRTNSQVALGEAHLDFRPMLNNPKAMFNVAQQLRAMPQHVQVQEESSEVSEVEQGLVIHHVLAYRILPGKCSDPAAKAQLARAGVECFTRAPVSERIAEFSQPGNPRYVADPQKRRAAIAAFQHNSALAEADTGKHIAELRKMLADPAQRAAIVARVGQAETARLGTLNDDQLKEEMINSGLQRVEETMFVPRIESTNYAHPQHLLTIAASSGEMAAAQQALRGGISQHGAAPSNYPRLVKMVPSASLNHFNTSTVPGGDRVADLEMGPYIFLAGFTIGHDYEWHWKAEITIDWCIVDCSSTYGIELHAGFNYAFGLRFPIQTRLKYETVVHANKPAEAKLTASFQPIDGSVDDYFSAGLPADQLYDAKELVAQVGADAGFSLYLPGLNPSLNFSAGVDFTHMLPAPLTDGQFRPPAPGTHVDSQIVFDGIDLLGGMLDYGVAGGKLLPAVDVTLHSNKLEFQLNDEILGRSTRLTANPSTVPVGVKQGQSGNDSHFQVGDPVYNLGFTLTPGLNPRLFIDIDIWSHHWDWPIWFPQLAVELPSHGIDFACHTGTTCVIDFEPAYNAGTGQVRDVSRATDAADRTLLGGGCKRVNNQEGNYLCPAKGMLGLCKTMLSNSAVSSCGVLVPDSTDEILKRGHCTGNNGNYTCPKDMIGLCNLYLKNEVILSCKQGN